MPSLRAARGLVIAQQRVDLARLDGERDVVIGEDAGKALGYATQLEAGRNTCRSHLAWVLSFHSLAPSGAARFVSHEAGGSSKG